MTTPTLHMNGTHPDDLLAGYCAAFRALQAAMDALAMATPNGRDYYTQGPDAFRSAMTEQRERYLKLAEVKDEIESLMSHVADQQPETGPLSRRNR